ncbi:hypothetical protein [Komagataeibacter sp. FNDCF1]|uniref:hypothetical protein n=1 Tax=Komagataeibacter sp. FNDCF1 TaxID=2878681 RepID=UPI001E4503D0|nr:hypothetical protein [Komagataeibacter sp. FNDCF1]MCE2563225.1 hypothetical protein [Komagataeibacter sp. FNDCF1]
MGAPMKPATSGQYAPQRACHMAQATGRTMPADTTAMPEATAPPRQKAGTPAPALLGRLAPSTVPQPRKSLFRK